MLCPPAPPALRLREWLQLSGRWREGSTTTSPALPASARTVQEQEARGGMVAG